MKEINDFNPQSASFVKNPEEHTSNMSTIFLSLLTSHQGGGMVALLCSFVRRFCCHGYC